LVQQHAQSFFAQAEEATGAGLPQFVKDEFDAFLECGMLLQMVRTVNEVWRMDFVRDSLANGRRMKCLTVADHSADRIRRSKWLAHRRASPA